MSATKEEVAAAASSSTPSSASASSATNSSASSSSSSSASSSASSSSDSKEEILDIRDPNVVTKYKKAAEIVQAAVSQLIKHAIPDAKLLSLVQEADGYIETETGKVYNTKVGDKKTEKGIAFPTSVSVNHIVGHFSPLSNDSSVLKAGDVVKVDAGVHIDGYAALVAHTFIVSGGAAGASPVTGKTADVLTAVHTASEAVLRLLRAGNKNSQITSTLHTIASEFKVNAVQGVLSHRTTRYVIDDAKVIINREDVEQKVEEVEFAVNDVWGIDIVFSTGEGKPKEVDDRTTIFKRNSASKYSLKMKASRAVLSEIDKRFPSFPFTLRALEEESKARFAIKECRDHDLVHPYPVLHEKEGEIVAQIKFTVFITEKGPVKITGFPIDTKSVSSEIKVQNEEVRKLLNSAVTIGGSSSAANKKKKAAKKKKQAEAAAAGGAGSAEQDDEETETEAK